MESLMNVKTLVVLESCLDVDVDLSPENELAQDQLIALKPSLFEFRDEQRLCPELMPIIQYLTDLSPEQSPEKHSKFQGYEFIYNDGCLYSITILLIQIIDHFWWCLPHYGVNLCMHITMPPCQVDIEEVTQLYLLFVKSTIALEWSATSANGYESVLPV
jgi:hypothetical protein